MIGLYHTPLRVLSGCEELRVKYSLLLIKNRQFIIMETAGNYLTAISVLSCLILM